MGPGINGTLLYTSRHFYSIPFLTEFRLFGTIYPINLAQNTLTTGLITFKIYQQHRRSSAAGVRAPGLSLVDIMRIFVESALLYTIECLLLIILSLRKSN